MNTKLLILTNALLRMPIILSKRITELNPQCFWLGGGEVDTKISKTCVYKLK